MLERNHYRSFFAVTFCGHERSYAVGTDDYPNSVFQIMFGGQERD